MSLFTVDKVLAVRGGSVPSFATLPDLESKPTSLDAQWQGRMIVVMDTIGTKKASILRLAKHA